MSLYSFQDLSNISVDHKVADGKNSRDIELVTVLSTHDDGVVKAYSIRGIIEAIPLNRNILMGVLPGEMVLIFPYGRDNYYFPFPLAMIDNIHHNVVEGDENNLVIGDFREEDFIREMSPVPGDVLLHGRYSNSVRLGSTHPDREEGEIGFGNILFRCKSNEESNDDLLFFEDINLDDSSFYITTTQIVDVDLANDNFKSIK